MVVKHRKKSRRKRGYERHSGLRRRGSGNRGGVGASGQGKRSKQKKHKFMKNGEINYGKHGFKSKKKQVEGINVGKLNEQAEQLGKKKGDKYLIDVERKKVLGSGFVTKPLAVFNYYSVTQKAKDKILKAGGEIIEK